jgi:putative transposase
MDFIEGNIYHVYNRGNNKKRIFYSRKNYEYFLSKVNKYILPNCLLPVESYYSYCRRHVK